MPGLSIIQKLAIWALPILFAVTLHEVSHGWVARFFGDHTAERMGRLSLNPLRHIDPVGTILVPAVMLLLTGFVFGWAKPVPVVASNMRNPRKDMAIVALAGPLTNLVMAIIWAAVLKLCLVVGPSGYLTLPLGLMARAGVFINLVLMVLNLIPVPPLDGSRVLNGLLPESWARVVDRVEPYGLLILILLLMTSALNTILYPPLIFFARLVFGLFGLSGMGGV